MAEVLEKFLAAKFYRINLSQLICEIYGQDHTDLSLMDLHRYLVDIKF